MNISELAKLAGVTTASVSRYLNNGSISKEKSKKIREAIAISGYKPKKAFPAPVFGTERLIAVITPFLVSETVVEMLDGISKELEDTGYNMILASAMGDVDLEMQYLRTFRDDGTNGVIYMGRCVSDAHYEALESYKKPIVVLNRFAKEHSCVYFDDYAAAYTAVKKLISAGCRRIAGIYMNSKDSTADRAKIDACYDAIKSENLEYNEKLMFKSDFSTESGCRAMKDLILSGQRFDGIFCTSDRAAFGAMSLFDTYGISVPQKVKMISIGGSKYCDIISPTLSSVRYNYFGAGREACRMLMEQIEESKKEIRHYKMEHELIERESTR